MANDKKAPVPAKAIPVTLTATAVFKVDSFLAEAIELTIVDGVVVATKRLNRGPDLCSSAAGAGSRSLWSQFATNKYTGQ